MVERRRHYQLHRRCHGQAGLAAARRRLVCRVANLRRRSTCYFCDHDGQTTVIKPGRKFEQLATNTLDEGCMASPAVDGRALYLAHEDASLSHRKHRRCPAATLRGFEWARLYSPSAKFAIAARNFGRGNGGISPTLPVWQAWQVSLRSRVAGSRCDFIRRSRRRRSERRDHLEADASGRGLFPSLRGLQADWPVR